MPNEKKMFKNPIMEFLSVSGPKIMIPFHIAFISYFIYHGTHNGYSSNPYLFLSLFIAGTALWTLVEYLLHRYIFHFVRDSPIIQKIHYTLHGYHHSVPKDNKRLFMPPVPILAIIGFFLGTFYLFLGQGVWVFMAGFELGYLIYAMIHYATHTIRSSQAPRLLKPLWFHHAQHHYQYPDKAFGVSNRFWDRVFGTMPPSK